MMILYHASSDWSDRHVTRKVKKKTSLKRNKYHIPSFLKPFEFLFLLIFITLYNAICDWFYIISCHSNKTSYFPFIVMFFMIDLFRSHMAY